MSKVYSSQEFFGPIPNYELSSKIIVSAINPGTVKIDILLSEKMTDPSPEWVEVVVLNPGDVYDLSTANGTFRITPENGAVYSWKRV